MTTHDHSSRDHSWPLMTTYHVPTHDPGRSALTRQTLLFSATLPKDVLRVAQFATREAQLIDTVSTSKYE